MCIVYMCYVVVVRLFFVGSVMDFFVFVFFCKQKTAYEMRISDWSSDVCSSDLSQNLLRVAGASAFGALQELSQEAGHADRRFPGTVAAARMTGVCFIRRAPVISPRDRLHGLAPRQRSLPLRRRRQAWSNACARRDRKSVV